MRASFALLALAAVASAGSISRRQLPACAMQCMATADMGSCDPTDNTCMCNSPAFVNSTYQCVQQTCTDPADLQAAIDGARALCAAAGVTLTETVPAATDSAAPTESTPETSAAETSPVETSAAATSPGASASTPAGSSSTPASVTGSAPASRTSASTRASAGPPPSGSASASASASSTPNGAVGPAGVSGIVGVLAAVAGFMFAL